MKVVILLHMLWHNQLVRHRFLCSFTLDADHPNLHRYVEKCIHCAELIFMKIMILMKISKFYATRCHILRLKCTKFDIHWGSAPNPAGGAYSTPPELANPDSTGKWLKQRQ